MSDELNALIIDDEELVGLTIRGMLRRADIKAEWTPDPDYFLELLNEHNPSIVFVDLSMPGTDGVSLLIKISEVAPDIPIALISGKGRRILEAARQSATEHGLWVKAVLEKPFHAEQVVAAVINCTEHGCCNENAVKQRRAHDQGPSWLLSMEQVHNAIETELIVPFFQPKIDCETNQLVGIEVLARWPAEDGRFIFPNEFIRVVEEAGLITEMTLSLARQTFDWMTTTGFEHLIVSLNLSAHSLDDEDFPRQLQYLVEEYELDTEQIMLELTETSAQNLSVSTLDSLTRLSLRGFQLSMDDFGTGYSSVAALTRMPFNELKVDQEFVAKMIESERARAVVDMVVALGKRLQMKVTAEGVEDQETLEALHQIGCDLVQGYHLGRPISGNDFVEQWGNAEKNVNTTA